MVDASYALCLGVCKPIHFGLVQIRCGLDQAAFSLARITLDPKHPNSEVPNRFGAIQELQNDLAHASWAGDKADNKSISGYVFYCGGDIISWASRKQTIVPNLQLRQNMCLCKMPVPNWNGLFVY